MKRVIFGAMIITLASSANVGCGGETPAAKGDKADKGGDKEGDKAEAEAPLDPRVAKAVEIADAIAKAPEDADAILEKHGLDRDKLDAMMFEIAKDPALAESYKLARAE